MGETLRGSVHESPVRHLPLVQYHSCGTLFVWEDWLGDAEVRLVLSAPAIRELVC
jgi:hypothetical protein